MHAHLRDWIACALLGCVLGTSSCLAQARAPAPPAPTTSPTLGHFPFLTVDAVHKQVRVQCEALHCDAPLEFFCCVTGTNEYESVLRSKVRPSHLHAALLMLGLKPGQPVHFSQALQKWVPPSGPRLHITVEFQKNGKTVTMPAYELMRDIKTKKPMPPMTWIFAGSKLMPTPNGGETYAADQTGYLVSVVNFELTVIDIPDLASSSNETLEWEADLSKLPPLGTKVTMILEPAGAETEAGAGDDAESTSAPANQGARQTPGAQGSNESPTNAQSSAAPDSNAQSPTKSIDQALVTIDAAGHITLDSEPVASADALVQSLQQAGRSQRTVRVAVGNAIEQNPTARQVINALAGAGIAFRTVPQFDAAPGMSRAVAPHSNSNTAAGPGAATSRDAIDLDADDALIQQFRSQWEQAVAPHAQALRSAAATHYQVITQLRAEQQRLIDEADKIQRLIDQLDKQYQDMTTPHPPTSGN
jgi:hypothetical protein